MKTLDAQQQSEISLRTISAIARALRDDDDMVLLLLRFADAIDDPNISDHEAHIRFDRLLQHVPAVGRYFGRNFNG